MKTKELTDYQAAAGVRLRESLRAGMNRPVLMAPTGYGKTVLACQIIENARIKGNHVWFTVPAIELVNQTVRMLHAEGVEDIGVMQAAHEMTDHEKPVQVVSVQTLAGFDLDLIRKPQLIIVDECHRQFKVIKDIIEKWPDVPIIGLSATPWAKGMGRFWTNLIISATTAELIAKGRLSPFRVFAPSHPDLTGVKIVTTAQGRDYAEGELSEAMQQGTLTADIVSTWLQRGKGLPTLVYGVDRAHALALHQQFEKQGVRSAYQDGTTKGDERERIRKGFHSGDIEVVCNIGTLTTGIDWDVRCIVLARPTRSEMLYVQIVGRGLRTAEGKKELLLLDHSDTTLSLGFVTDIGHTKLDDGTPKKSGEKKAPLPRECKSCGVLIPPYVRRCPACGFEAKPQAREVEVQDGELVELDGNKRNKSTSWSEKVEFMAGLKAYAYAKGYSPGWVAHKYKARFGVWPNDSRVKHARPATEVNPYIVSWVRSQNIRWAKSNEKADRYG